MRTVEGLEARRLLASFTASSVAELVTDINAANTAGGANTITLMPAGDFKLDLVDNATDFGGANGLPVVAAGDQLTIVGNGATIGRSSAKGTPEFRLFDVAPGASLALQNLTLSRGSGLFSGGGVYNLGTLGLDGVTVRDCAVHGWSIVQGGGIFSYGTLTVANSTIQNNRAVGDDGWLSASGAVHGGTAFGGGLYVSGGNAAVTNSTFASNLAEGGAGSKGGKIYFFSTPFWVAGGAGGNAFGGGIYAGGGGTVELTGTTITGNSARGGGGGTSPKGLSKGADGVGQAGGIYIAPTASVALDASTQANTRTNTASTADDDIFGTFAVLG